MDTTTTSPNDYKGDDIVTIAEAIKRQGTPKPTRQTYHDGIKRRDLQKVEGLPGREVKLRWEDVLTWKDVFYHKNVRKATSKTDCPDAAITLDACPALEVQCELPDAPDALSLIALAKDNIDRDVEEAKRLIADLPGYTDDDLVHHIKDYAACAARHAEHAVAIGIRALVSAWLCGKFLIKAKDSCGHGNFDRWVAHHLLADGICKRTAQRYMKLARENPDLRVLVEEQPGLRQAYRACGITAGETTEPAQPDDDRPSDDRTSTQASNSAEELLSRLAAFQGKLRQFAQTGEHLTDFQFNQLSLTIEEINRTFDQIRKSNVQPQTAA